MSDLASERGFLGQALAEIVRGFEVVEREIELAHAGVTLRAELAGVDALGRLWIVVGSDGDGERALLDALEWRAFARERATQLADEWSPGSDVAEVCVAIVALSNDATLARRARAADIELFELERWSSASGARLRLATRADSVHAPAANTDSFLAQLADDERALAQSALLRLPRIDEELELVIGRERLAWLREGRELASLGARAGRLSGRVGPGQPEEHVDGSAGFERWIERVLQARFGSRTDGELDLLPEIEERPQRAREAPLLTAEELAAFRD